MKKISIILIGGLLIFSSHSFLEESPTQKPVSAKSENWLLKEVLKVSDIYNTPFTDEVHPKEARRSMSRVINGLTYNVRRYNHGLAHAVRQAYLAKNIVLELRNKASTGKLAEFLQKLDKAEADSFIKKVQLLALYYRAGRQNEYSPSGGSAQEKARFDENMRAGAALFKEAAKKSQFFENDEEINKFAEALFHYEYQRQEKEFDGITAFVDQILYAAHILDLRRVTALWNRPPEGPKEMLKVISETLGFGGEVNEAVEKLNDFSGKYLKATGDRDAWSNRLTLSNEFFYQAYDPEMMLIKLDRVR